MPLNLHPYILEMVDENKILKTKERHTESSGNSTTGLKHSRLSMFCLWHLQTHSLYTEYDNKLDYKPDRNSYPHFSIFTPTTFLPF